MRLTTYTQNQKIEALKLWLVTGNLAGTAAALKIPYDTLKTWRKSDWWETQATEIKADGRLELSAKLRKIAEKALDQTLDRLENGDIRISPTGELQRVPVTAAVTAKIATDFIEKHEKLENIPQEQSVQGVTDKLKALADAFTKMSRHVRRIEVEDAESNGTSPEEGSPEKEDVGGEGQRLHLRYDEKDGMDTFDAEVIEKEEVNGSV